MYTIEERKILDRKRFMRSNHKWANEQLEGSGLSTKNKDIVLSFLELLDSFDIPVEIASNTVESVLDTTKSLFLGRPIKASTDTTVWVPVVLGEIHKRDTVKIVDNAYVGDHGIAYNGKVGRVVATSGTQISVLLDGDSVDSVVGHHPDKLLKKKM